MYSRVLEDTVFDDGLVSIRSTNCNRIMCKSERSVQSRLDMCFRTLRPKSYLTIGSVERREGRVKGQEMTWKRPNYLDLGLSARVVITEVAANSFPLPLSLFTILHFYPHVTLLLSVDMPL